MRPIYLVSIILFNVYVANVLFGKASTFYSEDGLPITLDDWVAALILFASIVFFVYGIFKYEGTGET